MEKYILKNDIRVLGMKVKSFPDDIGKAFEDPRFETVNFSVVSVQTLPTGR